MGNSDSHIRFIDLFCGIGGFRIAMEAALRKAGLAGECVFSCDIDEAAREAYLANFGDTPHGDITKVKASAIPDHDVLLAGFPCQAFSICGDRRGFEDARGTLFFDIARILKAKKPKAFVLENVRQLKTHDKGNTFRRIMETLEGLGYSTQSMILNAIDFGLPQKRERVFIAGTLGQALFQWPVEKIPMTPLADLLEKEVPERYYASDRIRENRRKSVNGGQTPKSPAIWHENKSGHISVYEFSCALRAGASYNYLLVDGRRRLTEREMLRLQGFPDSFKYTGKYTEVKKQAGNSLPAPVAEAVLHSLIRSCFASGETVRRKTGRAAAGKL